MKKNINRFTVFSMRLAFFGLFMFEFLNYLGILHFSLDFTWIGLMITVLGIWLLLEIVNFYLYRKTKKKINGAVYFLVAFVIYFDAFGDILHLYSNFGWYDQVMHFAGGAAVALIFFCVFHFFYNHLDMLICALLSISLGETFCVLFELEEYFEDYFTGSHRLGDGFDTANDLFLDLIGALCIAFIFFSAQHFKKRK